MTETCCGARYVNMFNANLDASPAQRKPVKQLKVEMRRWDEAEEKKKTRKKVDAKDIDPEEYQVRPFSFVLFTILQGVELGVDCRERISRRSRSSSRLREPRRCRSGMRIQGARRTLASQRKGRRLHLRRRLIGAAHGNRLRIVTRL